MRTVNPQDLEQLAKLLDGRGGLQERLDEAFTRASNLGVSGQLATLRPLRSWVSDTAPDLRNRAIAARLEDGDPEAGLRWAGFSDRELKAYGGAALRAETIVLTNSVAASGDPGAEAFRRRDRESIDDWLNRLAGHALADLTGLEAHEATVTKFVELARDGASGAQRRRQDLADRLQSGRRAGDQRLREPPLSHCRRSQGERFSSREADRKGGRADQGKSSRPVGTR